jgi:hypothetical protein
MALISSALYLFQKNDKIVRDKEQIMDKHEIVDSLKVIETIESEEVISSTLSTQKVL